jgi:hypothetical protein
MDKSQLQKLIKLTRAHENTLIPRAAIFAAMKEFGIQDNDPKKPEIFKEIAKGVAMERAAERKIAEKEMHEINAALAAEKHKANLEDAYKNQMRHPTDTYKNM